MKFYDKTITLISQLCERIHEGSLEIDVEAESQIVYQELCLLSLIHLDGHHSIMNMKWLDIVISVIFCLGNDHRLHYFVCRNLNIEIIQQGIGAVGDKYEPSLD